VAQLDHRDGRPLTAKGPALRYQEVRDLLVHHLTHSVSGDEAKAYEIYHDDAILEFPQSGERFLGKAEPFPAPDWRKPWAEDGATWEPQDGLPAQIRGGS
jgi:hypothetical protein